MEHASEVLKLVEAGLERNEVKARGYAKLLMSKLSEEDTLKKAISRRLDGSYKNDPELKAV